VAIFITDHGIDMPRAKGSLYDPGVEVALIMRYAESLAVRHAMLSHVDFLPTIVEIAGGSVPTHLDGRSFLSLIEGRDYREGDEIFFENTWHGFYDPMRGVRTKRFKYIVNFDPEKKYWAVESKAAREVLGRVCFGTKPLEEFYDLEKDPHEQENLASDRTMLGLLGAKGGHAGRRPARAEYAETIRAFRKKLRAHMIETNDPLLRGAVTHPGHERIWDGD
jgi:N-sulfoglucosamine sulfohydrolase